MLNNVRNQGKDVKLFMYRKLQLNSLLLLLLCPYSFRPAMPVLDTSLQLAQQMSLAQAPCPPESSPAVKRVSKYLCLKPPNLATQMAILSDRCNGAVR